MNEVHEARGTDYVCWKEKHLKRVSRFHLFLCNNSISLTYLSEGHKSEKVALAALAKLKKYRFFYHLAKPWLTFSRYTMPVEHGCCSSVQPLLQFAWTF